MRFGIFCVADQYPTEVPRSLGRMYEELLEQVEAADALGFDSFWVAEHHAHRSAGIPSPAVWLAAAAQRTRRIRLGVAVSVLPFRHPLQVAEEYAMVDVLSNGRLNIGVGSGYLPYELRAFNIAPETKRKRFDEALDVMLRAWTGERFSYDGEYQQINNVLLGIRPHQQPHPPLYVAVFQLEAAPHIGRRGFSIMMIPWVMTENLTELRPPITAFREAFTGAGFDPARAAVPFGLHTYVSDTTERAIAEAREPMMRYIRTFRPYNQRRFELFVEKDLVGFCGPEDAIRIARLYESLGFTDYLAIMNFGGLAHAKVLHSMEMMARHVLPAFEQPAVDESVGVPDLVAS
jgi:alkanesulfonate monooxygenase SsuD/methylene tetrahydromethanopterin reductase-like flavin-dependent oxidoreductase (luciferase family)